MGQDVILERSKSKSKQKEKPDKKNYLQLKSTDGEESEFLLDKNKVPNFIPNFHCKSMPSRPRNPKNEHDSILKRGSVYQTSDEVKQMRNIKEGRRKVDFKLEKEDGFISFDLGSSDLEPIKESKLEPVKELKSDSDEFLEVAFRDLRPKELKPEPDTSRRDSCLLSDKTEDDLLEIPLLETVSILSKSFSTKMGSFDHTNLKSQSNSHSHSSTFKRMLHPLKRSKSMKHPPLSETDASKRTTRKSLLNDFSKATHNKPPLSDFSKTANNKSPLDEFSKAANNKQEESSFNQSDGQDRISDATLSPAHLRATLKFDSKSGSPNFEFTVKDPVETITAKTWKTDNKLNWVYTFHNNCTKRVSTKEKAATGTLTPIIGQMQVSCYLCSEKSENGSLKNSAVTEFILYDIAHARILEDKIPCNSDPSPSHNYYPWPPSALHPQLETAAIVVEIPFEDSERKEMEKNEMERKEVDEREERGRRVRVVVPDGQHGVPEEGGEIASLIERWRFGGGCECGGWDMGCPISVFGNDWKKIVSDFAERNRKEPFLLFLEGSKEKLASISIVPDGEGRFSVDFHAQLSSLQAFAMCLSLLHCSESAPLMSEEKEKNKLYSSSLKLLLEEEVRHLIEAVSIDDKKKINNNNNINSNNKLERQMSKSFVVDHPPFSPLGRV